MDKVVLACLSVEPFSKRRKLFEVLSGKVDCEDHKLAELLCRQIAHPSRFGNVALASELLSNLKPEVVLSFLASQKDDDAFLWASACPKRIVSAQSKHWPATISSASTLVVPFTFPCCFFFFFFCF